MEEQCITPCGPVNNALNKKASLQLVLWLIVGIVTLSGVFLNAKMEAVKIQISYIEKSIQDIKEIIKPIRNTIK